MSTESVWRDRSEYVSNLRTTAAPASPKRATGWLGLALGLALFSLSLLVSGTVFDLGHLLFPLAGVAGLAAYVFATRWVARLPQRGTFTRFLERVRRALAYEG